MLALQNQSKREEERRAHEEMGHTIVSPRRVVNGMRTWEERVVIKTHPKYLNTHSTKIDFEQNLIIFWQIYPSFIYYKWIKISIS